MSYYTVILPKKNLKEYNWLERRAAILRMIEEAGHIRAYSYNQLSELFGVPPSTIEADLKSIKREFKERINDDLESIVDSVVYTTIKKLQKEGKDYMAAKLSLEWSKTIKPPQMTQVTNVNVQQDNKSLIQWIDDRTEDIQDARPSESVSQEPSEVQGDSSWEKVGQDVRSSPRDNKEGNGNS